MEGPGIELLEYPAPRDGRAAPELRANDVAHWQTTVIADAPSRVNDLLRQRIFSLVSPNVISLSGDRLGFGAGILVRDVDGHGRRIASRSETSPRGSESNSHQRVAFRRTAEMIRSTIRTGLLAITAFALTATFAAAQGHTSSKFSGAKVNAGTVTHSVKDGKNILTLSSDFQVPDTPDPHWQIVDSKGNTYLLQRLGVKSLGGLAKDRINTSITLPAYVKDVAKVQIYCAWAEAVLGEASFGAPLATMTMDK
jgi:hypothetical protein